MEDPLDRLVLGLAQEALMVGLFGHPTVELARVLALEGLPGDRVHPHCKQWLPLRMLFKTAWNACIRERVSRLLYDHGRRPSQVSTAMSSCKLAQIDVATTGEEVDITAAMHTPAASAIDVCCINQYHQE